MTLKNVWRVLLAGALFCAVALTTGCSDSCDPCKRAKEAPCDSCAGATVEKK